MNVQKIAAFSNGNTGGNPAGILIADAFPSTEEMQRMAAVVGFSETAYATPEGQGWRVRYFSPESEVPFCGHATIALGAALALRFGDGVFPLVLNRAQITVEARKNGDLIAASLQSPPTHSASVQPSFLSEALSLFGFTREDLDPRLSPALIHAGANHLLLALKSREALASMTYDLNAGRELMNREGYASFTLAYSESPTLFHTRNPFPSGGVYEDPATGAAAAALAGYLRDIDWPHNGSIHIYQGDDMGTSCRLRAEFSNEPGSSVRVSGTARVM